MERRKLITEWKVNGGTAKILTVHRDDLDLGSEEPDAWELIWIDSVGVRRHETFVDTAYSRWEGEGLTEEAEELLVSCPDADIVENFREYCNA